MNEIKNTEQSTEFLECERNRVFILMICVAGFFGGYTYSCRGGVFCNAQTANFVLFGISVGTAEWKTALYYVIPMISYLTGTIISEILPNPVKKLTHIRWDTLFVLFEMLVVLTVGFIPASAPVQICHIMINFICAMQYNTFRNAENIPAATTFCTAHTRALGVFLKKWFTHKDNKEYLKMWLFHAGMILSFTIGATAAAFLCRFFGVKAIWFAEILLGIVFADLIYADLTKEKDMLNKVPHGH